MPFEWKEQLCNSPFRELKSKASSEPPQAVELKQCDQNPILAPLERTDNWNSVSGLEDELGEIWDSGAPEREGGSPPLQFRPKFPISRTKVQG